MIKNVIMKRTRGDGSAFGKKETNVGFQRMWGMSQDDE